MSLTVKIKVIPSSGKQEFLLDKNETLKCFLKNPPEKGKVNKELVDFLAKKLSVPKNLISIVSGSTSRDKRVLIDLDLVYSEFLKAVAK